MDGVEGVRLYKEGDETLEYIQIYGERNSGTTYLARLLQDNMRDPDNLLGMLARDETPLGHKTFGYKHWFIDSEKLTDVREKSTLFVVIYRDPYTWLSAMMKRPYALSKSIEGRGVEELGAIKLEGHINGRDTQNELDPKTGDKLTIFQLREKKIANFGALKSKVQNV